MMITLMVHKLHPLRWLPLLFFLTSIFSPLFNNYSFTSIVAFEEEFNKDFNYDAMDSRLRFVLIQLSVLNDAVIYLQCSLSPDSTNNVTLLIDPETEWNITTLNVNIGESVNATVTNGNLNLAPDVGARFSVFMYRENITDIVIGNIFVGVLTRGWQKAPSPIVSGLLALTVLSLMNYKKKKRRTLK